MATQKIRVGIVGVQPDRSWAAIAHIPALQALPDFYEITSVSTTRQESADAAAARYNIPRAFAHHQPLVDSPDVDLVAVTVKVPHHLEIVTAALNAGKMVYCEWPLGNGLAEAEQLTALADAKKIRTIIGLQARYAPPLNYVKDLIAQGYVGQVLSVSLVGSALSWGAYVEPENAYNADLKNGVTPLTIPVAHTLDAICATLGEVESLSALLANRRHETKLTSNGEAIPLTAQDQVLIAATLQGGVVLSSHYRGGIAKGTNMLLEINGTEGDLQLTSFGGHAQIFDLSISGANGAGQALELLPVPAPYYHTPVHSGPPANVAEVYAAFAQDLKNNTHTVPGFAHAVTRHRLVDAVERAAATGNRQTL